MTVKKNLALTLTGFILITVAIWLNFNPSFNVTYKPSALDPSYSLKIVTLQTYFLSPVFCLFSLFLLRLKTKNETQIKSHIVNNAWLFGGLITLFLSVEARYYVYPQIIHNPKSMLMVVPLIFVAVMIIVVMKGRKKATQEIPNEK